MHQSWAWRKWCLNSNQLSWTFLPSRVLNHGIPPSRSLKSSPEVQDCDSTYCPASSTQAPELHHLLVTEAKAAPSLHILNWSFFVCQYKIQQHISPHWLLHHLYQKVFVNALQEPPRLCVDYAILSFQQISGWLKSPMKTILCFSTRNETAGVNTCFRAALLGISLMCDQLSLPSLSSPLNWNTLNHFWYTFHH